jgi:hypothetical protein
MPFHHPKLTSRFENLPRVNPLTNPRKANNKTTVSKNLFLNIQWFFGRKILWLFLSCFATRLSSFQYLVTVYWVVAARYWPQFRKAEPHPRNKELPNYLSRVTSQHSDTPCSYNKICLQSKHFAVSLIIAISIPRKRHIRHQSSADRV